MKLKEIKEEIEIPNDIDITIDNYIVKIKGEKGELQRNFFYPNINIKKQDNKLILSSKTPTKREKAIINTFKVHLKNMIKGVIEGYTYKLKICSSHFPMSVELKGNNILIKNFFGEKTPRKVTIVPKTSVSIEGDIIVVSSIDKEAAGQTAANIERATRITNRDIRIFQDGIYIIEKAGKSVD